MSESKETAQIAGLNCQIKAKTRQNLLEIARFGNLTKLKGNFSGLSDSLLGILITVLGIQLDTFIKLGEQEERIVSLLNLHHELLRDVWLEQNIQDIIKNYYSAKSWESEIVIKKTQQVINDVYYQMRDLARGTFNVKPEEEIQIETELLKNAKKIIRAAAYIADDLVSKWWLTESGSKYLESHVEKIKEGIEVQRIFIIKDAKQLLGIKDLIQRQEKIGIKVWITWSKGLSPLILEDFMVVDDTSFMVSHSYEGVSNNVIFSVDKLLVEQYSQKYHQIFLESRNSSLVDWNKSEAELQKDLSTWSSIDLSNIVTS